MVYRSLLPLKKRGLLFFCLFLTLMLPMTGGASTLSLESFLGFNEHFRPGHWTPLTVTLENRGRDFKGELEVVATSGSEYLQNIYQNRYTADIELPYNAKRLYAFSIQLDSFTHDLEIRVRQGDEVLLERSVTLRSLVAEKPFVVVADEKASPDFLSDFPADVFPINVRPRFLPEHGYAYESVRMLVLNIEILPTLRESQFRALQEWIEQGGYLVLNGGMNVGAFSEPRVNHLFPARILGHQEFTQLESLQDFCGKSFRSKTPFLLWHLQSPGATTLLEEGDVSLLTRRNMGKGRILFSAFHSHLSAFREWDGKLEFWDTLLALSRPAKEAESPTLPASEIQEAMSRNLPVSMPNIKTLMLFLALYLLLLRWFFRRLQKHRGEPWGNALASLLVTLLFLSAAYLFFRANDKNLPSYNTVLHLHGSAPSLHADARYIAGLYTIQENDYTLFFDSASYPIGHLPALRSARVIPQPYRLHQGAGRQEIHGRSGNWRSQFFQFSSGIEFPLSAEARLTENGLELLLRNTGERTIRNCHVYVRQRVLSLDDLKPGEEQKHHIPRYEIGEEERFDPYEVARTLLQQEESGKETEKASPVMNVVQEMFHIQVAQKHNESYLRDIRETLLPDVLEAVHAVYRAQPDRLCVVGWLPENQIDMKVSPKDARGNSVTLITWEVPLQDHDN